MSGQPGRFGRSIKRVRRKTDTNPNALAAKKKLRELVLDEIGPDNAHVFDAFAGDGRMYREVWAGARSYVGCDLKWYQDDRTVYVGDNTRVLRAIDLQPFNVFDLDAYGSPWHHALIIGARRKVRTGETVGLVVTEGSGLKLKFNSMPTALKQLLGLNAVPAGLSRQHDDLIDRAVAGLCGRMNVRPTRQWRARGKTGTSMRYIAMVVEGM